MGRGHARTGECPVAARVAVRTVPCRDGARDADTWTGDRMVGFACSDGEVREAGRRVVCADDPADGVPTVSPRRAVAVRHCGHRQDFWICCWEIRMTAGGV